MNLSTHDSGYKLLYAHEALVRDLLTGFMPGDWVRELDLATLERCSGSYVSDDLRDRADDLIWRVRWGRGWLYVYLLLEFQSSIDPWMAVRIQTYIGLLYQDLIRAKQLSGAGRLPPVLPIVLYNGVKPWDAALELEPLIEPAPAPLSRHRPRQGYLLIDERRVAEGGGLPERNLCTALFRLEASRDPAEVMAILRALLEWLRMPEQASVRRAFAVWLGRVFLPRRLPGVPLAPMNDLFEVHQMLTEQLETWTEQWRHDGLEQGRKETRHLLIRQVRRRFGPAVAAQAEPLLAAIVDPEVLEALGEELLIHPDGERWLEALRQAQPAPGHSTHQPGLPGAAERP